MHNSFKLMIVDDHTALRQGLRSLLKEIGFQIIYEAENGKEALELLKDVQPDIILLDIDMPVMNGIEALGKVKQKYPTIKVIILTGHYNELLITEVLKLGADGYLPKNCDIDDLVSTMHSLNDNIQIVYQNMQPIQLSHVQTAPELLIGQRSLTEKEVNVLILICQGKSRKEIAEQFDIKARTITFHTENIYKKTKLSNRAELYKYAIQNGYMTN